MKLCTWNCDIFQQECQSQKLVLPWVWNQSHSTNDMIFSSCEYDVEPLGIRSDFWLLDLNYIHEIGGGALNAVWQLATMGRFSTSAPSSGGF